MAEGGGLGKRLADRLRWLRETPGVETLSPEAWEAEAARCREEGVPEPPRGPWIDHAVSEGWTPVDPFHVELLDYETFRRVCGDVAAESEVGPVIEWPAEWGPRHLVLHRREIAHHFRECERIAEEEARQAGGR